MIQTNDVCLSIIRRPTAPCFVFCCVFIFSLQNFKSRDQNHHPRPPHAHTSYRTHVTPPSSHTHTHLLLLITHTWCTLAHGCRAQPHATCWTSTCKMSFACLRRCAIVCSRRPRSTPSTPRLWPGCSSPLQ